ncbi:hypothetical protein BGZ65_012669 [Modicella reniformis]|uniref:Uncharacterized protein n=1 Tax=Modicella reniformis TaxID=1440133 RepID=A0A9P6IM44_9FUNG|nr:hypothetical protein BGZ65_012669 [Modicella reniformis]
MDDSHPGSMSMKTTTTSKSMSTLTSKPGYGIQRLNHRENHGDNFDMEVSEPPQKRLRSTTSMLIDAALETVIFTGAVALSAYQLLTGKGKHSQQSSTSSLPADDDIENSAQKQGDEEADSLEDKLSALSYAGAAGSSAYHHIPHIGHTRSYSTPIRPDTGTEDTDETFLRMEAQLNNLIAEGKRALKSRIEVWDDESSLY